MGSGTKTIKLSKKYQDHVTDLLKEQRIVQDIIENTFSKFQNENNYNVMEYALDILVDNFTYVSNDTYITPGKYVRYLDMKNPLDIKLRIGGFALADNGYTVTLKGSDNSFRVSKKNGIFFTQITDTDKVRAAVNEYV